MFAKRQSSASFEYSSGNSDYDSSDIDPFEQGIVDDYDIIELNKKYPVDAEF